MPGRSSFRGWGVAVVVVVLGAHSIDSVLCVLAGTVCLVMVVMMMIRTLDTRIMNMYRSWALGIVAALQQRILDAPQQRGWCCFYSLVWMRRPLLHGAVMARSRI